MVDPSDDSLCDGTLSLFIPLFVNQNISAPHGEEFEEEFPVPLGNPSSLTHAISDDAGAERLEPPEDVIPTLGPEEAKPTPTQLRPRADTASASRKSSLLDNLTRSV